MGILDLFFGKPDEDDDRRKKDRHAHPSLLDEAKRDAEIAAAHHKARQKRAKSKRRWFDDEY